MHELSTDKFWTIESFDPGEVSEVTREAFSLSLPYVKEFLCAQHPYREGPVCPFVSSALRQQRIHFTECAKGDASHDHAERVRRCIEFYQSSKGGLRTFGAVIMLFPPDYDTDRLSQLQFENKEQCVRELLMIGSLFPGNNSPSLRNPDYFPLRMPTPCLVIRDMVPGDLAFLHPSQYNLGKRLIFLEAFIRKFEGSTGMVGRKVDEAKSLRLTHLQKQRTRRFAFAALSLIAMLVLGYFLFSR